MARTTAKDHDDKRRLILNHAAALFAEEGFDRASVSSIAGACGISKANIYHYYESKDAILFDILDRHLSALRDRICGLSLGQLDAKQQLNASIVETLLAYQGADNEHRLQTETLNRLPREQQTILIGYQRELVKHMSALVEAIAPEVFANDKDRLRATTMSVFGMLNWFYMWNGGAGKKEREEYGNLVSNLCLGGIPKL